MTVKDVLDASLVEVWITCGEDPLRDAVDLKIKIQSDTDLSERDLLSTDILESEVNLMTVKDGAVFISILK